MKGMFWQKLRGLQDAGFLYISLKRSLPPIFDMYLQFLPTHSFHNLRQTLLFKYSDVWWFYGQLELWATKTMVQCIPTSDLHSAPTWDVTLSVLSWNPKLVCRTATRGANCTITHWKFTVTYEEFNIKNFKNILFNTINK